MSVVSFFSFTVFLLTKDPNFLPVGGAMIFSRFCRILDEGQPERVSSEVDYVGVHTRCGALSVGARAASRRDLEAELDTKKP